jgi:hypothetical protein
LSVCFEDEIYFAGKTYATTGSEIDYQKMTLMKTITKRIFPYSSSLLFTMLLVFLSGCRVRDSFGYAFFGTFLVMGIALVIATVVTRRAKRFRDE